MQWLSRYALLIAALAGVAVALLGNHLVTIDRELLTLKNLYLRPGVIPHPEYNPFSDKKYELGRMLFFDPRLSDTGALSCASCHHPGFSWMDGLPGARGKGHVTVARRTMTVLNLAWDKAMLWDRKATSLEQQVYLAARAEFGMNLEQQEVDAELTKIKEYQPLFEAAFSGEDDLDPGTAHNNYVNMRNVSKAIAAFERLLISGEAPFDRWISGDEDAISESAKRGFLLFNKKADCASCHSGWNFSDAKYYDIGIDDPKDLGAGAIFPNNPDMKHAFKAVGLRNIDRRGPYMHNGSLKTLHEVVEFYDRGGDVQRESVKIKKLHLTEQEKADLVAFMQTLTSEDVPIAIPMLPR